MISLKVLRTSARLGLAYLLDPRYVVHTALANVRDVIVEQHEQIDAEPAHPVTVAKIGVVDDGMVDDHRKCDEGYARGRTGVMVPRVRRSDPVAARSPARHAAGRGQFHHEVAEGRTRGSSGVAGNDGGPIKGWSAELARATSRTI